MSLIKKLAGETAIYGISSILGRLLNYVILTPYLTNVFLTGEYGVISDMYTYVALIMVILTYRMETAFFRFASREKDLSNAFSTASFSIFFTTIIFVVVMLLSAQPIAELLKYPDHKDYVIWFILVLAFDALSVIPFAKLRLENRPIKFAVLKVLNILVNIFFIIFFLEICPILIRSGFEGMKLIFDVNNRIAYIFISNMLASLVVVLALLPEYLKIKLQFDANLWKKMLGYAMPLILVGIAGVINQLISVPMLKELLPYEFDENMSIAGKYAAVAKIAILMSLFIQAFNYAAEPFFFRNADRSDSHKIYADVGQAFALVGSVVFLGIMLYLDVIKYFIGSDFRENLTIVPLLLIAYFFLGLYYNFSIWYKLTDRTEIGAWIAIGGAIITLSINFTLIPQIGYTAPAWAAVVCYAFMALTSWIIGRKYYPIAYPIGRMLAYIGLAILCWQGSLLLLPFFGEHIAIQFGIKTLIMISFLGILYLLEKQKIKELIA